VPEFEFDFNYLIRLFSEEGTFEQKMIDFIGDVNINIYSPIVVFDKLICDGFRPLETFKERMATLPESFSKETVLDIGCNTGYMLMNIKKHRMAGLCYGIDTSDQCIFVSKVITHYEKLDNIDFEASLASNFIKRILNQEVQKFDNILCFGVFEFRNKIENDFIPDVVKCANKKVIIEFANHPHNRKSKEEVLEYFKVFEEFGTLKTTFLEYQNRPVLEIDVSKKQEEKQPIVLSL